MIEHYNEELYKDTALYERAMVLSSQNLTK